MMKLIDVMNMIAKGELEEGTKIKIQSKVYTFESEYCSDTEPDFFREDLENGGKTSIFGEYYLSAILNEEVEIIGHDTNVATKIEELRIDIFNCEALDCENEILRVKDKLNEVIRELNRRGE